MSPKLSKFIRKPLNLLGWFNGVENFQKVRTNGTKYPRMDQVKFVAHSFES